VPAWLLDLHKFLGTLSVVFVAIHLLALWADNFVYFGPRELFVPFASAWRTGAVAWGITATYLLVAIQLTSWAMKKLPRRLWHRVHLLSIPMFVMVTVHGFTSGADAANLAVQWIAVTAGLAVFLLVTFRVLAPRSSNRRGAVKPAPVRRAQRVESQPVAPAVTGPAVTGPAVEPDAVAFRGRAAERPATVAELAQIVESALSDL